MRPFAFLLGLAMLAVSVIAPAEEAFDLDAAAAVCTGCHGKDGVPIQPDYPIIAGQEYFYTYTQLRDYAAGRRQRDIMTGIASQYSRTQAKELAQHFAARDWPEIDAATEEGDRRLVQRGITGGQCSACHGKWGGDGRIPRLAGQNPAYLEKTMKDFKAERRMNAPDKLSTMQQLDDKTIEALARYLAAL